MIQPPRFTRQGPSALLGAKQVRVNPASEATQSDDACPSAVFFVSVRPILPYAKALSTRNNTHIAATPGATAQRKNRHDARV